MPGSDAPRWRAFAKALGWTIAFFLLGLVLTVAFSTAAAALGPGSFRHQVKELGQPGLRSALIQGISQTLGFGLSTWLIGFRVLKLTTVDLRWRQLGVGLRFLALGLLIGIVPALVSIGLAITFGGARFLPDAGTAGEWLRDVALTALALAPAALSEELIFRGVPQVALAKVIGRAGALLMIAGLFGAAHLFNPGSTPLAITNIALAGIFLGLVFYTPGGLWAAFGAHLGWNATLAAADAPVSGLPLPIPYIDYSPGGPAWLTGGSFGPEGGVLATASLALALPLLIRWTRQEAV
jgi:membrane protease YdiL (CAAX protease family)